jgi:hypothetical protein
MTLRLPLHLPSFAVSYLSLAGPSIAVLNGISESQGPPVALASSAILPASSDQAAQSPNCGNDSTTAAKVFRVLNGAQVSMLPAPSKPCTSFPAQQQSCYSILFLLSPFATCILKFKGDAFPLLNTLRINWL